jgi:hypothetical protein
MLGDVGLVQKKIIEKRKWSGVLFDINDFQFSALLIPMLPDQR